MNKIKIAFIGTADIGSPLLQSLHHDERFEVKLVVTQIDKPAGRKMELKPSPIKLKAKELGISVFQPEDINSADSIKEIRKAGADMIVLMAYGQILKSEILELPEFGCINIHASLLPKHRGASPVTQSLLHQDEETGISIMKIVEKMDYGPVYATSKIPITDEDNATILRDKIAKLTAEKAPDILYEIVEDGLEAHHQDHQHATYCKKIHKADGAIDWNESADTISAKVRAFAGWPGTHTFWNGKRIKILSAKSYSYDGTEESGTVISQGNAILIKCKKDALLLEELQMEGKNSQTANEFVKGYPGFIKSNMT
jgi:methionyl-tRNA formyltransferase